LSVDTRYSDDGLPFTARGEVRVRTQRPRQPSPLGSLMRVDFDQAALPEPILSEIALCLFAAFRKSFRM